MRIDTYSAESEVFAAVYLEDYTLIRYMHIQTDSSGCLRSPSTTVSMSPSARLIPSSVQDPEYSNDVDSRIGPDELLPMPRR